MSEIQKNEAEFQAYIKDTLKKAFPWLPTDFKLEYNLKLVLGHKDITINGKSSDYKSVNGRYDVLVLSENKPLMLVELKKPNIELTDRDMEQALSYARLIPEMPPLVALTNGEENKIHQVYDDAPITDIGTEGKRLTDIISQASKLATGDAEAAVKTLLGCDLVVWETIFDDWNQKTFESLSGSIGDFSVPFCNDFSIPRDIVTELISSISNENNVIAIHGEPQLGVTNVLEQFCKTYEAPVFYINSADHGDVIREIANRLTREMKYKITKDDVFTWLNTMPDDSLLTIVLDGQPKEHFDDLLYLSESKQINLVCGFNSTLLKSLIHTPGRCTKSKFGRLADIKELSCLNECELELALGLLFQNFDSYFYNGIKSSFEFHRPRNIRVAVSSVARYKAEPETTKLLSPIIGVSDIYEWGTDFQDNLELKEQYQKIVNAYFEGIKEFDKEIKGSYRSWGQLVIPVPVVEKYCKDEIDLYKKSGILKLLDIGLSNSVYAIRNREPFIHMVGELWAQKISEPSEDEITSKFKELLVLSEGIPNGAAVLAYSICKSLKDNQKQLSELIKYLENSEPTCSTLGDNSKIAMLHSDGVTELKLPKYEGLCPGNLQSWVVLSYLAGLLKIECNGEPISHNANLIGMLGSYDGVLLQIPLRPQDEPFGYHTHNIFGKEVLCHNCGIIEPIQQAILNHATVFPDEFLLLTEYALKKNIVQLWWRLLGIANILETYSVQKVSDAAKQVKKLLENIWKNSDITEYKKTSNKNIPYKSKPKIGRNEKCPCDSGKKYKKCCLIK